jgi:hypothetical protein
MLLFFFCYNFLIDEAEVLQEIERVVIFVVRSSIFKTSLMLLTVLRIWDVNP